MKGSEDRIIRWSGRVLVSAVFACSYISAWRHEWGDMVWSLFITLVWVGIEIRDVRK